MSIPRRTIEEWLTYFRFARDVRHVFVEGSSDQALLGGLFRTQAVDIDVHIVEEIDLGGVITLNSPFCSGNRARLVSFSQIIEKEFSLHIENVICFIDRDCEDICPVIPMGRQLIMTDFSSLFASYIEIDFVNEMLERALRCRIRPDEWAIIMRICRFLFTFRILRYIEFPDKHPLAPESLFRRQGRKRDIDCEGYIVKFLSKNALSITLQDVKIKIREISKNFHGDDRMYIHFHDFMDILVIWLRNMGCLPPSFRLEHVRAILYGSARPDFLKSQLAISELLRWARNV